MNLYWNGKSEKRFRFPLIRTVELVLAVIATIAILVVSGFTPPSIFGKSNIAIAGSSLRKDEDTPTWLGNTTLNFRRSTPDINKYIGVNYKISDSSEEIVDSFGWDLEKQFKGRKGTAITIIKSRKSTNKSVRYGGNTWSIKATQIIPSSSDRFVISKSVFGTMTIHESRTGKVIFVDDSGKEPTWCPDTSKDILAYTVARQGEIIPPTYIRIIEINPNNVITTLR